MGDNGRVSDCLWSPSPERARASDMARFMREAGHSDYAALHRWSVEAPEEFWMRLWRFCGVKCSREPVSAVQQAVRMQDAKWFFGARLNFAENLLQQDASRTALIYRDESGSRSALSYGELRTQVERVSTGLSRLGIGEGDSVVAWMPNRLETVVLMLAAASLGAAFSSCSPDFGAQAVLERFRPLKPSVLLAADGYYWRGQWVDCHPKLQEIRSGLPELKVTLLAPHPARAMASGGVGFLASSGLPGPAGPRKRSADVALFDDFGDARPLEFAPLSFDHPLYVVFSSGTMGAPKCIIHRAGGVLIQHMKEHRLHVGLTAQDTMFYLTTCGWMMWNWLISGLASGCALLLYDGSPLHPDPGALWSIAADEGVSIFGASAAWLKAMENAGEKPGSRFDLSSLHTVLSTGSPLAPQSYDYVYREIGEDLMLSSIAGGTDLMGCFATGNPMLGVYRGEMQCRALGMAVDVFDGAGRALRERPGELVCTKPFPSTPLGFLNDPDGEKYHRAYFDLFPGVWTHGDFAEITERGGVIIHGRSDAVLNPRGIRIGTAEIYRVVEALEEVEEALAVGQQHEGDTRIILFLRLAMDAESPEKLKERVRAALRRHTSPRHVPARIIIAPDLPRTVNGKISELAVRELIHGRRISNIDALANPESIDFFTRLETQLA